MRLFPVAHVFKLGENANLKVNTFVSETDSSDLEERRISAETRPGSRESVGNSTNNPPLFIT